MMTARRKPPSSTSPRFDVPRELVFRCMTEPQHLVNFWGPVGVSTPVASITMESGRRPLRNGHGREADGSRYPSGRLRRGRAAGAARVDRTRQSA